MLYHDNNNWSQSSREIRTFNQIIFLYCHSYYIKENTNNTSNLNIYGKVKIGRDEDFDISHFCLHCSQYKLEYVQGHMQPGSGSDDFSLSFLHLILSMHLMLNLYNIIYKLYIDYNPFDRMGHVVQNLIVSLHREIPWQLTKTWT